MAKPSIPLLPECTPTGEVIAPAQFSCCFPEDLFNENSIQFYDLAGHAKYKEHFANESYQEAIVYLFRRARILSWQAASTARAG
jgi:hypothetical protein